MTDTLEVQLMRWSESSSTGRTVTFWLPPEGEHPFKAMQTRSGKTKPGQRFAMALALITDDETQEPVEVEKPKERFADMKASKQAGILCNDLEFQDWLAGTWPAVVDTGTTAECVRNLCGVTSRRELNYNLGARDTWQKLLSEYDAHRGAAAEER